MNLMYYIITLANVGTLHKGGGGGGEGGRIHGPRATIQCTCAL